MPDKTPDLTSSKIMKSKIKSRIYQLFSIYQKLTLAEIATYLSRDKSSIHPHVHKLIEWGYIKPPTIVDNKRSYIFEKSKKALNIRREINLNDRNSQELLDVRADGLISVYKSLKRELEDKIEFWERMKIMNNNPSTADEAKALFNDIFDLDVDSNNKIDFTNPSSISKVVVSQNYFTEESYKELYKEIMDALVKHFNNPTEENPEVKRPLSVLFEITPDEQILKLISRKDAIFNKPKD